MAFTLEQKRKDVPIKAYGAGAMTFCHAARRRLSDRLLRCHAVQIRDEGFVRNKAVYIALGILPDATEEIPRIWIEQTEGAKFWLRVMNELKNRGVANIQIAVVDGLEGFPEAINAVFAQAIVQTCIVHLIRDCWSSCRGRIARQ